MKPFDLEEIVQVTGANLLSSGERVNTPLTGITTDSRAVQPGSLFIALKGPNSDGHEYVNAAFEKGALAAVVSGEWMNAPSPPAPSPNSGRGESLDSGVQFDRSLVNQQKNVVAGSPLPELGEGAGGEGVLLTVPNTEIALGQISGWHAQRLPARRVGVTGSSGKTTTKEMIAAALGASGSTHKNKGSQNGETGVPLALLKLEESQKYAVLEMGMRGPGQIRYLAEIVRPEVGVITNIGKAHIELLGSVENIARAKGEMLEYLAPNGTAILPVSDAYLPLLKSLCKGDVLTYGTAEYADVQAYDVAVQDRGMSFRVRFPDGKELAAEIPLLGTHNVLNATAAFAVVHSMGANLEAVRDALAQFQPPAMRGVIMETSSGVRIIHDAYNANPDSVRAALEVLSTYPKRRVAILGDMLELGESEIQEHRSLGHEVAKHADLLIAVGPRSKETMNGAHEAALANGEVHWFEDSKAAALGIRSLVKAGDTVLVKGSRGMKMEVIAEALAASPEEAVSAPQGATD